MNRSPHLAHRRGTLEKLQADLREYEKLVEQTVQRVNALNSYRAALNAAAQAFTHACSEFLEQQHERLKNELTSNTETGVPAAASTPDNGAGRVERLTKIKLVTEVQRLGYEVRLACFKSQALRDPALIREANELFP